MKRTQQQAAAVAAIAAASVLAFAPSALAAPTIKASKTTGIKAGDTITVQVSGLTPNEGFVTLGLCEPKPKLPTDCASQASGGALQGKSDAAGNFLTQQGSKQAKLKMLSKAGDANCASRAGACVIAVTALGANMAANTTEVPLTFSAGSGNGGGNNNGGGDNNGGGNNNLPKTGSPDGVPTYALVASALVMAGGAALLIIPRRRRRHES